MNALAKATSVTSCSSAEALRGRDCWLIHFLSKRTTGLSRMKKDARDGG